MTDVFIVLFPVNNPRQQDLPFGHFLNTARGRWEVSLPLFSTCCWERPAQKTRPWPGLGSQATGGEAGGR